MECLSFNPFFFFLRLHPSAGTDGLNGMVVCMLCCGKGLGKIGASCYEESSARKRPSVLQVAGAGLEAGL